MAPQVHPSVALHRPPLEHPRHILIRYLIATAGAPGGSASSFQRAVEERDAKRRDAEADGGDEQRRHTHDPHCDQPDQEGQDYGGVKTVFASRVLHRAPSESTPDR
jgi:hypothetical protein